MRIIITENYEEMSFKATQILASQVILKPNSVLGLATGSTPEGMYKGLIKYYREKLIDFSLITTINLDEYYGIKAENEQSYHYYMNKNLFSKININKKNIHIPLSQAKDIEKECKNYDHLIESVGGIDLQVLGIGQNGHIGFNEPDIKFEARTHLVNLDKSTIEANSRFFNDSHDVPKMAISMGIKNIMQSKKIVLLASGIEKSEAIFQMVKGPITPNLPASVLQLHPDVVLIIDKKAASKL
ncbi:glucosamine-6-phosphate deaminase [Helicovermis profundi]|uniref:Glucosamine-6-phosphate deaminase n=1 Tax=Helicovermis profundi TaxID=3065157 RepID=A0AAU9ECJ4_9FIRM|nr:glucosamine-6-phosphate deaminase [Clostridia bacterium S502]